MTANPEPPTAEAMCAATSVHGVCVRPKSHLGLHWAHGKEWGEEPEADVVAEARRGVIATLRTPSGLLVTAAQLQDLQRSLDALIAATRSTPARVEELEDQPWPTRDMLRLLADVAEWALDARSYDAQGYEAVRPAIAAVRALAPSPEEGGE